MKFLCDQMLVRVGRWLRAAGYDTVVIEKSMDDRKILERALKEGRYLITRDIHFVDFQEGKECVIWLQSNSVDGCIRELNQKLKINWLMAPFSRCLLCNEKLLDVDPDAVEDVPEDVRKRAKKFWTCPKCHKTYWEGSHTNNMLKQLRSYLE